LFISSSSSRLGELLADLVEALDELHHLAEAFLDDLAHAACGGEVRFLRQVADADAGLRPGLALEFLVDAGHDPQQRGLARAVQAEHADLGAGEEAERDVLEDETLGRNDLAHPVHRVNVLRHWICLRDCRAGNAARLSGKRRSLESYNPDHDRQSQCRARSQGRQYRRLWFW
jgi:hypothetical protein